MDAVPWKLACDANRALASTIDTNFGTSIPATDVHRRLVSKCRGDIGIYRCVFMSFAMAKNATAEGQIRGGLILRNGSPRTSAAGVLF